MIKSVIDFRGMKRFKKSTGDQLIVSTDLPDRVTLAPNAKAIFRKMTNTTQYATSFGEKPREKHDFLILDKKPLIKLPISQVLKPNIAQMISKWLTGVNDQEKFSSRIFYTVREMYTCVKN